MAAEASRTLVQGVNQYSDSYILVSDREGDAPGDCTVMVAEMGKA